MLELLDSSLSSQAAHTATAVRVPAHIEVVTIKLLCATQSQSKLH